MDRLTQESSHSHGVQADLSKKGKFRLNMDPKHMSCSGHRMRYSCMIFFVVVLVIHKVNKYVSSKSFCFGSCLKEKLVEALNGEIKISIRRSCQKQTICKWRKKYNTILNYNNSSKITHTKIKHCYSIFLSILRTTSQLCRFQRSKPNN